MVEERQTLKSEPSSGPLGVRRQRSSRVKQNRSNASETELMCRDHWEDVGFGGVAVATVTCVISYCLINKVDKCSNYVRL